MAFSQEDISNAKNDLNYIRGTQSDFKSFKQPIDTYSSDFLKLFQDPTYLGFKLFFHGIGQETNTNSGINSSGLLGPEDNPNSALFYLKQLEGETGARFNMLKDFKALLIRINTEFPWYFQSIEGLEDAWKRDINKPKFMKELTITCLESIDLRITGLMDLYRKVVYDWKNRRYVLPDNLRHFEMTIKVFDNRNFGIEEYLTKNVSDDAKDIKKAISDAKSLIPKSRSAKATELFLGTEVETERTQLSFDFNFCEFVPDESSAVLSGVSNVTNNQASQKIKIKYENIEENNLYKSLIALGTKKEFYYVKDYIRLELDTLQLGANADFLNPISDVLVTAGNEIAANVSQRAASVVKSRLNNLLLGNVYGFDAIQTIQDPIGTASGAVTAATNAINDRRNSKSETSDNVFSDFVENVNNTPLGNIFD